MAAATPLSPAEIYDRQFVPSLFQHWGEYLAQMADIHPGQSVLDVACGTGVLACSVHKHVGAKGNVVGLDPNDEMLVVARRKAVPVEWQHGRAESLPFSDASFDHVVSQFGFMFFEDRLKALAEMMRVLRPGGRLTMAVCDAIDHSPGYAILTELLHRLFGTEVAEAFRAPFSCGDRQQLLALCTSAGISDARVTRHDGPVHFDSIQSLVATERACAWTLGGLLNDDQFERLAEEAEETFQPFVMRQGKIEFTMPVLVVQAEKR